MKKIPKGFISTKKQDTKLMDLTYDTPERLHEVERGQLMLSEELLFDDYINPTQIIVDFGVGLIYYDLDKVDFLTGQKYIDYLKILMHTPLRSLKKNIKQYNRKI